MLILKLYAISILSAILIVIMYIRYKVDQSMDLRQLMMVIGASLAWPLALVGGLIYILCDPNVPTPVIIKSKTQLLTAKEEKIRKRKEKEGYDR